VSRSGYPIKRRWSHLQTRSNDVTRCGRIKQRLHQASFREAVITAYKGRCALSALPEPLPLDAAHIVTDNGPMLEALKRLDGGTIYLPNRTKDRPDRERFALLFERFKAMA
jgi:putative restriction endonuclease